MRLSFRFRWIPFAATVVLMAIGVSLGNWQTRRAEEKLAIEQAIAERGHQAVIEAAQLRRGEAPPEFTRIAAEGEFIADWPLYLENRPHGTRAGYYLLMPFRLADGRGVVPVLRGWFARDPIDRTRIPDIPVPAGRQRIEGTVRAHAGRVLQLGDRPALRPGAIVQNVDIDELASASGLSLHAFIIEQRNDSHDGLVREWPAPSAGVDKHRGYAFQWYALAAAAFLFYIVTGFISGSKRHEAA